MVWREIIDKYRDSTISKASKFEIWCLFSFKHLSLGPNPNKKKKKRIEEKDNLLKLVALQPLDS